MMFRSARSKPRFSWARTGAEATAIAVHAVAFLVLILPVTPPLAKEVAKEPQIVVQLVRPESPPVVPLPPMPQMPKLPVHETRPVSVVTPVVAADTPLTVDEPGESSEPPQVDNPPQRTAQLVPATALGYGEHDRPVYPLQAIRQRHEGKVTLLVRVGVDGAPKEIKVAQTSGYRELDRAAVTAAWKWRFRPGSRDGVAYEAWARVPIDFRLDSL